MKTLHDWSKAPEFAKSAHRPAAGLGTEWLAYRPAYPSILIDYEERPAPEEKPKTLHDWGNAPPRANWAYRHNLSGFTHFTTDKPGPHRNVVDLERRPEPAETCEEQEAWDQLEAAKRKLFEQRMEEAHAVKSSHPQKSHAEQLIGLACYGHPLEVAFNDAVYQAKYGKGERHGGDFVPFYDQQWTTLADHHGVGFLTGQAAKKLNEAAQKDDDEAWEREVLGAIVYAGMAILKKRGYPE